MIRAIVGTIISLIISWQLTLVFLCTVPLMVSAVDAVTVVCLVYDSVRMCARAYVHVLCAARARN